jgi:hypothetical protein
MDVIGFLCVSLVSSTVQLHDSLGSKRAWAYSEAGFSSQNGERASGVYYRRAVFCCGFFLCGQKVSMQRIFMKNFFLFTVGSVCREKRFTTGWQTFRKWRRVWNRGVKVADTTVKRHLCCGFRLTDKAMGQVYQYWWTIYWEINVFSRFEYHMFYVLYPFVTYLLTLPRTLVVKLLSAISSAISPVFLCMCFLYWTLSRWLLKLTSFF